MQEFVMAPRFEDLSSNYADLWQRMEVLPDKVQAVSTITNRLIGFKSTYQKVSQATGVPWFVIAALHNRESDADFDTYLGNGEPLNRVTRLVPKGRGPFPSWEAGAIDALDLDRLNQVTDWSPERACYEIEKFNGFGYRAKHVNSPYLWSFSNNYQSGKYVADGVFNPSVVDKQCGAMPIVKQIMVADPTANFQVSAIPTSLAVPTALAIGSRGDRVTQLQSALKQRGYPVGDVDGIYGSMTQGAVVAFQRDAKLPMTGIADQTTIDALQARAPTAEQVQPVDILRILFSELGKVIGAPSTPSGRPPSTTPTDTSGDVLRQIMGAFLAKPIVQSTSSAGATSATSPQVILSPIDKALGGQALAGKKTALAIVAYAVMAILQAVGVVGAGTPAGVIINTIIAAFGALGGISKVDRVIQALGVIATKRPG
jgi:lysozyme family protein/peptidoglycan hydrolase-like protein with peptidoglycan-binding domain